MNNHAHSVISNLVAIIDQELLPNVAKITVQDYQRLNETLIRARNLLDELEQPASGTDIYTFTAAAMLGVPVDAVSPEARQIGMSKLHEAPYGSRWRNLDDLVALHTEQLSSNEYAYFELAYTRRTGWMAWVCSHFREDNPNREVIACGQADTPESACARAMDEYRSKEKRDGQP